MMKAIIRNSNIELVGNLMVADSIFARMKGLLGKTSLPEASGLWLKPCKGVHTFGMGFNIDVVFLNKENQVVAVYNNLHPNQLTRIYPKAATVIELPANSVSSKGLLIGDFIDIIDLNTNKM